MPCSKPAQNPLPSRLPHAAACISPAASPAASASCPASARRPDDGGWFWVPAVRAVGSHYIPPAAGLSPRPGRGRALQCTGGQPLRRSR